MKTTLFTLLASGILLSSVHAAPEEYRASSVPGVRVRSLPRKHSLPQANSIYIRPGARRPDTSSRRTATRRGGATGSAMRALPGGGHALRLDPSSRAASRAKIVNGRAVVICTLPGHSKSAHFHDARGAAHRIR